MPLLLADETILRPSTAPGLWAGFVVFVLIMVGFLLQWPTLLTLVMFPILLIIYIRLARREEREAAASFGAAWDRYAHATPPSRKPMRSAGKRRVTPPRKSDFASASWPRASPPTWLYT